MLAKTSSLLTAAVLVAFTAAENATTSLPPNLLGYYQMSGNDACELTVHIYLRTALIDYNITN